MTEDNTMDEVGRLYFNCPNLDLTDSEDPDISEDRTTCIKEEANLISSLTGVGTHKPVLDIDIPCRYVPSTTPGHGHLYIDTALPWVAYEKLLNALAEAGIIQQGYLKRSLERKATFVRPPWVKKPEKLDNAVKTE